MGLSGDAGDDDDGRFRSMTAAHEGQSPTQTALSPFGAGMAGNALSRALYGPPCDGALTRSRIDVALVLFYFIFVFDSPFVFSPFPSHISRCCVSTSAAEPRRRHFLARAATPAKIHNRTNSLFLSLPPHASSPRCPPISPSTRVKSIPPRTLLGLRLLCPWLSVCQFIPSVSSCCIGSPPPADAFCTGHHRLHLPTNDHATT